jgi:hypothetical protein
MVNSVGVLEVGPNDDFGLDEGIFGLLGKLPIHGRLLPKIVIPVRDLSSFGLSRHVASGRSQRPMLICRMALGLTDIVAVLALLCVLVAAYAALKWP